jgi:hypothetical protein
VAAARAAPRTSAGREDMAPPYVRQTPRASSGSDDARRRRDDEARGVRHYILSIEGPNFTDVDDVELLRLPAAGEPIETKYGTCIVTGTEELESSNYDGKIICRLS